MNIVWQMPDKKIALTSVFDGSDPVAHAALLLARGDVPADWEAVAFGVTDFPPPEVPQEEWRYVGGRIVAGAAV